MIETLRSCRYTAAIFLLVLILLGLGLTMVYSSSAVWSATNKNRMIVNEYEIEDQVVASFHHPGYLRKQVIWIALGMLMLFWFYSVDYEMLTRHHKLILALAVGLLALVFVPGIGVEVNYARRWIRLGIMNFQPSEFAKLALVIFMSKYLYDHREDLDNFKKVFVPCLLVMGLVLALVVIEPDFGATVVLFAICVSIWFMAGMRLRYICGLFAMGLPVLGVIAIAEPYRVKRLLTYFNPTADIEGRAWQVYQSFVSVGSGGLFGKGIGQGMQKYRFLAESHNDFIFAIIGEELGLIGTIGVILAFCLLIGLFLWVAYRAIDYQGALLASGISMMIAIPALIHIGVVIGMLPPKGLNLPFISYGGSAAIVNLAAVGILMNVARSVDKQAYECSKLRRQRKVREKKRIRPTPIWAR